MQADDEKPTTGERPHYPAAILHTLKDPAPDVYVCLRDGSVRRMKGWASFADVKNLRDPTARELAVLHKLGAKLLPRRWRRAAMRELGLPWPMFGGAPTTFPYRVLE